MREENASHQETPHYIPLQTEASPVLPQCQTKLGSRNSVLPHALPVSRDKHHVTHILSPVRIHVCLRANSPVLLQSPSPCVQAPCWPITGVRDGHFPAWDGGGFSGSNPCHLFPVPGATVRGWDMWQEHHTASITLAPALLNCCWVLRESVFPRAVLIRNEGQLDMAETTTEVCFPSPSTPSAPLGRWGSRAGFVPQPMSRAMTQDLAWPGSY